MRSQQTLLEIDSTTISRTEVDIRTIQPTDSNQLVTLETDACDPVVGLENSLEQVNLPSHLYSTIVPIDIGILLNIPLAIGIFSTFLVFSSVLCMVSVCVNFEAGSLDIRLRLPTPNFRLPTSDFKFPPFDFRFSNSDF